MSPPHDDPPPARATNRDREPVLDRLGPPGWREFAAARRRFETTLAVQGLERAFARPARDAPRRRDAR